MRADTAADAPITTADFQHETATLVEGLRLSVARVLARLPGHADRAADLARALDLDAALAWQLHSLASQNDPLLATRLVPKTGSMSRFIRSAQRVGVPEPVCGEVEAHYRAFEKLVNAHAGNREDFDAMISAIRGDDAATLQKIRRTAFRANAPAWGISATGSTHLVVFHEQVDGAIDCLALRGRIGLRRFQQDATITLCVSGKVWGGGDAPPQTPDGAGTTITSCEIINTGCWTSPPKIESISLPNNTRCEFLRLEGIGRKSVCDVFWRNVALGFPGGSRSPPHGMSASCLTPAEYMIADLLIPTGWADPGSVKAWITPESGYSGIPAESPVLYRLPFEGRPVYLGNQIASLQTHLYPQYPEMVLSELNRMDWASTTYDIFRCEVKYPVLHSTLQLCVQEPRIYKR